MEWENLIDRLSDQRRCDLSRYLERISHRPICIYGAGSFGRELYQVFRRHEIAVRAFLDRNAEECTPADIPICYPEEIDDKDDIVLILGIVMNKSSRLALKGLLSTYGFHHVVDGQSIRAHYVYGLTPEEERDPVGYYREHLQEIQAAGRLFDEDAESSRTYRDNLAAHILRDYSDCFQTDQSRQYFVDNVPFAKGFSRFIDCGSYIGDTLQELCDVAVHVEEIAAFEPNLGNFLRLSRCYDEHLKKKIEKASLYPCGVAGKTEQRPFQWMGGSSSIVSESKNIIQCVALDDVLKNFAPTFIKMDIEGAEYGALQGCKGLIANARPDLAISVYHIIDDFWRIPLLLHRWNLGYRFYLRTHSSCCMETILYAVCAEEGEQDVSIDKACGTV